MDESEHKRHDPHEIELLRVEDVTDVLSCGRAFVFTLIASGDLEVIKLGRLTRVPRDSLDAFISHKLNEHRQIEDNIRTGRPIGLQQVRSRRKRA